MSLIWEVQDHIAVIKFNRPEAMNAMDPETYAELSQRWIEVRDNPDIWVAVITGVGDRAFTAGADLRRQAANVTAGAPAESTAWRFWQTQGGEILNRGLEVWKPVIAAINGYCLGGGMTLLYSTDLRIAAEHATFSLAEVKRGILPGNGGTQRTLKQLPYAIGMEMLLYGDQLSAQEAYRVGLINKVVPKEQLMDEALEWANRLCQNPPLAVRAIKELAVRSQYLHIQEGIRLEGAISRALGQTDDAREGRLAFAEKRKANFSGR